MGHAQRNFPLLKRVHQRAHFLLILPTEGDFRLHFVQPSGLIARNRVLQLTIARRGVVEIMDGFVQRIGRKRAHLTLELAKSLAAKLEQLRRIRQIAGIPHPR